jgi:hypothetical protein
VHPASIEIIKPKAINIRIRTDSTALPPTVYSFAMGWSSVVRQPIQKLDRITGDENKN